MSVKLLLLTLFLLFIIDASFAFNFLEISNKDSIKKDVKIYVGKILLEGNKVTDEEIILRELKFKPNSFTTIADLEESARNLYNLALFTKVDFFPIPETNDKINLLITVEETYYIIPIPRAGFKDSDFKKFWAGLDFKWRNFRGRNETLGTGFSLGYDPSVTLSYQNPWIGKNSHFFTSFSVKYSLNHNNSYNDVVTSEPVNQELIQNYELTNFNSSFLFGKYFNTTLSSYARLSYNNIHVSDYAPGRTVSKDGLDSYPSIALCFNSDRRNIYEFTTDGSFVSAEYEKTGIFHKEINFSRIRLDLRKYVPAEIFKDYSVTFAFRFLNVISWGGNIPSYLNKFFGYDEIIRGWNRQIYQGENQLGLFGELRLPIINPGYIPGKDIPFIKNVSYLKNFSYKYGVYLTLFWDSGTVWDKNENVFKTNFINGFGPGITVFFLSDSSEELISGFKKRMINI